MWDCVPLLPGSSETSDCLRYVVTLPGADVLYQNKASPFVIHAFSAGGSCPTRTNDLPAGQGWLLYPRLPSIGSGWVVLRRHSAPMTSLPRLKADSVMLELAFEHHAFLLSFLPVLITFHVITFHVITFHVDAHGSRVHGDEYGLLQGRCSGSVDFPGRNQGGPRILDGFLDKHSPERVAIFRNSMLTIGLQAIRILHPNVAIR